MPSLRRILLALLLAAPALGQPVPCTVSRGCTGQNALTAKYVLTGNGINPLTLSADFQWDDVAKTLTLGTAHGGKLVLYNSAGGSVTFGITTGVTATEFDFPLSHGTAGYGLSQGSGNDLVFNPFSGVGTPTACSHQFVTSITLAANAAPTTVCTTVPYADVSGTPTLYYQTIQNAGVDLAQRAKLNVTCTAGCTIADNSGAGTTDLTINAGGSNHNLLSSTHSDTTAASPTRGDGIFAIGSTPTWQRLAHPSTSGGYFKWNGTDVVASSGAASGTGNCTSPQFVTGLNADAAPTCADVSTATVFKASGTSHAAGIVPDPGSTAGLFEVINEDTSWAEEFPGRNSWGSFGCEFVSPQGTNVSVGTPITVTGNGTGTTVGTGATGEWQNYTTTTTNQAIGWTSSSVLANQSWKPRFVARWMVGSNAADVANIRFWATLSHANMITQTSDTPNVSAFGFRYSTAASDPAIMLFSSDASGLGNMGTTSTGMAYTQGHIYVGEAWNDSSTTVSGHIMDVTAGTATAVVTTTTHVDTTVTSLDLNLGAMNLSGGGVTARQINVSKFCAASN